MLGVLVNLVLVFSYDQVPRASLHPEWGPEPPVAPYGQEALPAQPAILPLIFPVVATCRWVDGYNEERGKFRHTGIDIRGPKMSPVVAPIAGIIGFKKESFWIYSRTGWAILGTHLNDDNPGTRDHTGGRDFMFAPNLVPGQAVHSGQFIGYLGESGDATAPHLHFEIYAPGPGSTMTRIRNPFPSLKAAQVISAPVVFPKPDLPPKGFVTYEGCIRKVDAGTKQVTLILSTIVLPNGEAKAVTHVRYLRVGMSSPAIEKAGGWGALEHLPETSVMSVTLPASKKPDDVIAERIEIPNL